MMHKYLRLTELLFLFILAGTVSGKAQSANFEATVRAAIGTTQCEIQTLIIEKAMKLRFEGMPIEYIGQFFQNMGQGFIYDIPQLLDIVGTGVALNQQREYKEKYLSVCYQAAFDALGR